MVFALYNVKQDSLYSKELYMYGNNRLGYIEDEVFLGRKCIGKWCNVLTPVLPMFPSTLSNSVSVVFGKKRYEISDWLGNVRVVINDRKTPINSGNATVGYKAQVVSVSDYYSFGSEIAERSYDPVKPFYRFGFNTQEKTFELNRDHYTAKFWEYDARLGRRWNVDPKPNAALSNYAVLNGNPILFNDLLGDSIKFYSKMEEDKYNDFRKMIFSNKSYSKIQEELKKLENAREVFMIRIGENVSSESGGGNFIYNTKTKQFDVNIKLDGDFSLNQKLAHELKHAYQYLEGKLAFYIHPIFQKAVPILYDENDEREAYRRQNEVAGFRDPILSEEEIKNKLKYDYKDRFNKYYGTHLNNQNKSDFEEKNKEFLNKRNQKIFIYHEE